MQNFKDCHKDQILVYPWQIRYTDTYLQFYYQEKTNERYLSQNFMNRLDFPTEAKEEFMRIMDRIHTDQKLLARFDSAVYDYMQTSRDKALHLYTPSKSRNRHTLPDALNRMRILALQMEVSPYTLQFVFCIKSSRLLLEIYQEKLIPEWIFWNTMEDFYCKLMECKNVMNVWGIFVAWWYDRFFDASRFGLGQLQFELEPFRGSKAFKYRWYNHLSR